LRNLREQLDRREQSEQEVLLSREEILRSITELQSVLMEEQNTIHFDDITELSKRLLQEILRKDQQQMVLNRRAIEPMEEILAGLDDGDFDYSTLRRRINRLDALVAAQAQTEEEDTAVGGQQPPPPARNTGRLSQPMMRAITEI
jgi:hypothetical protein|tara:strand:+ start:1930 stop:2364 length:435 start_codon:yes stop_codon:yes gene_type:complete